MNANVVQYRMNAGSTNVAAWVCGALLLMAFATSAVAQECKHRGAYEKQTAKEAEAA